MKQLPPPARAAIPYAHAYKWKIHPLRASDKTPMTANGLKDATCDDAQVETWWTDNPTANIGLNCGASGLVALDFDISKPIFLGGDLLAVLLADHPTTTSATGGGGMHLLYQQPEAVKLTNTTGNLPAGVDVRGHGGYIVLPPSVHPNGTPYKWMAGRSIGEMDPQPLPDFVLDLIQAKPAPAALTRPAAPAQRPPRGGVNASRYAEAALNGELSKLRTIGEGGRNDQLNRSGFALGGLVAAGVLDESTVVNHLEAAAHSIGLGDRETLATIRSGVGAGMAKPRQIPDRQEQADTTGATSEKKYPRIITNKRQDRDILSDAIDVIRQVNQEQGEHPALYVRAGILSQVATDENGTHFIRNAEGAILSSTLVRFVDWVKQSRDKDGNPYLEAVPVPERIVKMLEVTTDWSHVPSLEGVALAPVFAPDGTLHSEPGYNRATKLYNAGNLHIGDSDPTDENVTQARQLLMDELMGDFPFVDDASRAHALALILLPFVRPMIAGSTPNHLIDAPTPGTGKSLLADLCTIPFAGGQKSSLSLTKSEDEFSKAIITALLSGRAYVCIDNLPQSAILDSAKLASAITEPEIADRTMRTHTAMIIRPRCGWITTGNNTKLSLELTRRTVHIRLDRNSEKPWDTEGFKHPNIRAWALEHRSELATAAITLIRRWLAIDKPKFAGKQKGSFSEWAQVIGGILQSAGVPGFLENEQAMFENTVQGNNELWHSFIEGWYKEHRDLFVKVGDLFKLASHPDKRENPDDSPDADAWLGLLDEELQGLPEPGRRRRFGRMMEDRRDVVIGKYKIAKGKVNKGSTTWRLQQVG